MNQFTNEQKNVFARLIIGLAILFGLFLLTTIAFKIREYRYVGSGINPSNIITVNGEGKVNRSPDTAKIDFTVSDVQKDIKLAQNNVSNKIDSISNELKKLGIEDKYIKTTSYNSYPQYDYPKGICTLDSCPGSSPVLRGYKVSHNITVSVKSLDSVPQVLSVLADNKAESISGPNFGFEDDKEVAREARELAINDAKSEAQKLAKSLGVKLVRIVSFTEDNNNHYPIYSMKQESMSLDNASAGSPSLPIGENNIESHVTIGYEIQ